MFKINYYLDKIKKADDDSEIPMKARKPIWIVINSFGGMAYELFNTLGKIEHFKEIGYKIYTLTTGKAMSCGLALQTSGSKKFCYRYSTFLYHQVSSVAYGKISDMKIDVVETDRLDKMYKDYIAEHSKITSKDFKEHDPFDWFFGAETALKLGIVDEIL